MQQHAARLEEERARALGPVRDDREVGDRAQLIVLRGANAGTSRDLLQEAAASRATVKARRRMDEAIRPLASARSSSYWSAVTCSNQSTALPSSFSWMAMWVMAVVGAAPCQCFSPGGIQTTSPGRISSTGPPHRCTRPAPDVTTSV